MAYFALKILLYSIWYEEISITNIVLSVIFFSFNTEFPIFPANLTSLFVDLRLNRIEAATLEENIASKNLLKKIGFKKEGVLRKYLKINGTWRDHILYGLLENDFK